MIWTCAICGLASVGNGVLGIQVWDAKAGQLARWHTVHGDCFDETGLTYGVDFDDIRGRGLDFWLEHIGGKAWAEHTDYWQAFSGVARRLGDAR